MLLKDESVDLVGIQPQMLFAAMALQTLLFEHGIARILKALTSTSHTEELDPSVLLAMLPNTVITAATDGPHSRASLHYSGSALDFRTRDLGLDRHGMESLAKTLRERLGHDFDVVLEETHLHVEWQPKRRA